MGRDSATLEVFTSAPVNNGVAATHEGVDVSDYQGMTVYLSSNVSVTLYVQFSSDNVNWYDLKAQDDTNRSWNCNNEKICVAGDIVARYVRLVVYNASGSTATITAGFMFRC